MIRKMVVLGVVVLLLGGSRVLAQESEALYSQKCANCHAKDGSGNTNVRSKLTVPDLRSKPIVEMNDSDMYDSIAHGAQHKEYPHAFLHIGMTEEQVHGLVKYIRVLQHNNQQGTTKGAAKP